MSIKAKWVNENIVCPVCLDVVKKPYYCANCYKNHNNFKLICKNCYLYKCHYAKAFKCPGCSMINPPAERVGKEVKDYLNSKSVNCPNFCTMDNEYSFKELSDHLMEGQGDGFAYSIEKLDEVQSKIKEMQDSEQWVDLAKHPIELKENWDTHNATCLICQSLAALQGYICCLGTAISCQECGENFTKEMKFSLDEEYHPYSIKGCGICKKYSGVRVDRLPHIYDRIVKYEIEECNECDKEMPKLPYLEMLQHEKICRGEMDASFEPNKLSKIPYFHPNGSVVKLFTENQFTGFFNENLDPEEEIKLDTSLSKGFKVGSMRLVNKIFIVGGEGTECKTFTYNFDTNQIESTSWDLKYARMDHSLCTLDNVIICTGSSVVDDNDKYTCKRVEIFSPDWDEWREGVEMHYDRCKHMSVVGGDTVYCAFGWSPTSNMGQDGIEFISYPKLNSDSGGWMFPKNLDLQRFDKTIGILPYPYDGKFIIFGQKDDTTFYDDEESKLESHTFDANDKKKRTLESKAYNISKHTFDLQNMPLFYKGEFYVFSEEGSSVYVCNRDFSFSG